MSRVKYFMLYTIVHQAVISAYHSNLSPCVTAVADLRHNGGPVFSKSRSPRLTSAAAAAAAVDAAAAAL